MVSSGMSTNLEDIERAKGKIGVLEDDYDELMILYCLIYTSIRMFRGNGSVGRQVPTPRAQNWTNEKDKSLVGIMRSKFEAGYWSNGSFTKQGWKLIYEEFCTEENEMTSAQVANRWKALKEYHAYHYHRNKSGWGWDCQTHSPAAPTEDAWMELDDVFRKFRGKTFPLYDDMEFIVGRDIATGGSAIGTQLPHSADISYEEADDYVPHDNPPDSGSKRAAPTSSSSVKRRRGHGDGSQRSTTELKEILTKHISMQERSASREFEREDIAYCKSIIAKMVPQLQGMEYMRILDMLGDAQFHDVLRSVAEEGEAVLVHWLCHKLKS